LNKLDTTILNKVIYNDFYLFTRATHSTTQSLLWQRVSPSVCHTLVLCLKG